MTSGRLGARPRALVDAARAAPLPSVRKLRRLARRLVDEYFCDRDVPLVPFGKENVWHLLPPARGAFVLSGGVGKDVSTELELATQLDCRVHLFDPSPTGVATMSRPENQHPNVRFVPMGLAGASGEQRFAPPVRPDEGSFSVATGAETVSWPCTSFGAWCRGEGIAHVDLVKLDIEGFEYAVIDDMLASGIEVGQLCVEFHDGMYDVSWLDTAKTIGALTRAGFRLVHKNQADFTFLRG